MNLGLMYSQGKGVAQDYATAASWYRKAAEQGYASAQYNLGAAMAVVLGLTIVAISVTSLLFRRDPGGMA